MGTSQSHCHKYCQWKREGHSTGPCDVISHPACKDAAPRGKPSPPSQPLATDVTHNSVTLSWQPPRRNSGGTVFAYTIEVCTPSEPKAWTVVTKCCQGNSYQVKNLAASSQYMFRVRAENIHGLSKGSRPSEVVETKMFGVEQQLYVPAPEDRVHSAPRHQPSISLHLEGTVTSLLNHTDIQVKTTNREAKISSDTEGTSLGKSERGVHRSLEIIGAEDRGEEGQGRRWKSNSLQRDAAGRLSLQPDRLRPNGLQRDANGRSSLQPDRWRSNSLQREAHQRSSWQPSRKRSLPILLPGTRTDSLNKLRESQSFPATSKGRLNEGPDTGRKLGQTWRERSASDVRNEDVVDGKKCSSKEDCSTDGDLKPAKRDSGLEEDAENPWERDDSASEASDGVTCDDKKAGLYSHSLPDTPPSTCAGVTLYGMVAPGGEVGQADFRTLRSLLHSDDVIVRSSHSLPDMAVGSRKASPHNTLSTILDQEEDEDSVRITTL
ncbi:uncharacterized protein LOC143286098 [Babylonia areolata]|uniref:uncharacterized protein LOC143286098 n=1 Tax=Babylonia areolata TaxID=304850 RepID=UPI003FD396FD